MIRYETQDARRDDPHRHQEARPLRQGRPPHHRRSHRQRQPRHRLGVCPCLHRRRLAHRLLPDHARREEGERRRLPEGRLGLLPQPRRHGRPGDDRQRLCYRSYDFRDACRDLGLKHIRTKPYTPKTNGKAERFIQTALREWAYAQAYPTSERRAAELPFWLHRYNWHRPHGGIKSQTPISRLALSKDNLLRLHPRSWGSAAREKPTAGFSPIRRAKSKNYGALGRFRPNCPKRSSVLLRRRVGAAGWASVRMALRETAASARLSAGREAGERGPHALAGGIEYGTAPGANDIFLQKSEMSATIFGYDRFRLPLGPAGLQARRRRSARCLQPRRVCQRLRAGRDRRNFFI